LYIYFTLDKRAQDAGRCAGRYPGAGHPHAWACLQLQCPFYSRTGRTHRIVLTIVYTVTQPAENKNSYCVWFAAWNFMHAGQIHVGEQLRVTLKTPYNRCSVSISKFYETLWVQWIVWILWDQIKTYTWDRLWSDKTVIGLPPVTFNLMCIFRYIYTFTVLFVFFTLFYQFFCACLTLCSISFPHKEYLLISSLFFTLLFPLPLINCAPLY
jgi:hypothetical protein